MKKVRNLQLLFLFLLFLALLSLVHGVSFDVKPSQTSAKSGARNWNFNFTVNNTNNTAAIIQLNITLPEGFEFINESNSTNTVSNFTYDVNARNLTWNNSKLIDASSSAWFSFNLSIPLIFRTVNFTLSVLDNSSIINTTNISVEVVPESVSTSREFGLYPGEIYLNWTNNYEANLSVLSNSTSNVFIIFNNETSVTANYSQESSRLYIRVKNNTAALSKTNFLPSFDNTNYTLFTYCYENGWGPCKPGRYFSFFTIKNSLNPKENASLKVTVDLPLNVSNKTGVAEFNGKMPRYSTSYHSFFFDLSNIKNATSITLSLNFAGDLDVFLLTNETPYLISKSINKEGNESLNYNFLRHDGRTYEIRIYGNSSSEIPYTGKIIVLQLNSSEQKFDFGVQNASASIIKVFNLSNEGNIPIQNVEEDGQIYYVKSFNNNGTKNFTFFLPDSSIMPTVKAKLNWIEDGAYNLSLFNPEGVEVGNSFNRSYNANVCGVEKEEFVEVDNIGKAGFWRVEVKSISAKSPAYNLTILGFFEPTDWIKTNFTNYQNKAFNPIGSENSTKTIELNFTIPERVVSGVYEGFLIYRSGNGGMIKIPIRVNVTTPMLVVNDTLEAKEIVIEENFNATLTKTFYINISNLGNYNLTTSFLNSTRLSCIGCPYYAGLSFNKTTEIQAGSSALIEVNVFFNSSMPKDSVYAGWIFINSTNPNSNLTGRPYPGFNISIKLRLTDRWNITVVDLRSVDYGNNTVNVSSKTSWVNVSFLIQYVNGTNVKGGTIFSIKNITNIWLSEPNASYRVRNLDFSNITPEKATLPGDIWAINLTIPANLPGGKYYVRINLTSEKLSSNPADFYRGESLDEPKNKQLIVDDMGLLMSFADYPSELQNGTSGTVNVTIKNLGPRNASNVQVRLEKCEYISTVSFLNSSCSFLGTPSDRVNFTLSGYNYTGCYIAWRITAGGTAGSCTSWIKGISGLWFGNLPFSTKVTIPEITTTTTIPNITTTTTTTITTTTTTTTIPTSQQDFTTRILNITVDSPGIVEISQPGILKFQRIMIYVKRNVSNVEITVKEGVKPENVPAPVAAGEGLVLKYLEVEGKNINDDDILMASIDFQVEKSWVVKNNIDISTIALYRYHNNSWETLRTTKVNETSEFYQFKSISRGLSLFAIAGKWTKGFPIWIIFVIAGIIAGGLLAFLFWPVEEEKPKAQTKKEESEEAKKIWEELKKKWEGLKNKSS